MKSLERNKGGLKLAHKRVHISERFDRPYALIGCLEREDRAARGENPCDIFLGVTPMEDRKTYFDASPMSYAIRANNKLSVLLSWGTEDDLVDPHEQSKPFMLALKQAGFFVRSAIVPFAPHYWTGDPIDEPGSFTGFLAPRMERFLLERL